MFNEDEAMRHIEERLKQEHIEELKQKALADPCVVIPRFFRYLNLKVNEREVMGRIWSFQRAGAQFFESYSTVAEDLCINDRQAPRKILNELVERGYLIKKPPINDNDSNVYEIDLGRCLLIAEANGYPNKRTNFRAVRKKKKVNENG